MSVEKICTTSWIDCYLAETLWATQWVLGFCPEFVINKSQAYVDYGVPDCVGRIMYCERERIHKHLIKNVCKKDVYDFLD